MLTGLEMADKDVMSDDMTSGDAGETGAAGSSSRSLGRRSARFRFAQSAKTSLYSRSRFGAALGTWWGGSRRREEGWTRSGDWSCCRARSRSRDLRGIGGTTAASEVCSMAAVGPAQCGRGGIELQLLPGSSARRDQESRTRFRGCCVNTCESRSQGSPRSSACVSETCAVRLFVATASCSCKLHAEALAMTGGGNINRYQP